MFLNFYVLWSEWLLLWTFIFISRAFSFTLRKKRTAIGQPILRSMRLKTEVDQTLFTTQKLFELPN